jgi:hypothetical protein
MVSSPMTRQDRTAPPSDARRGRRARRWIIVLVVVVGLLVGADFGLAAFAEHEISQKAHDQLGLTQDPSVTIHGFPFTTQALGGDYSHITVYAAGVPVPSAQLKDVEINAELTDVKAPLSDLMAGRVNAITIGKLEAEVTIKATDINGISPLDNVKNLRIEPSSEEYVRTGKDSTATTTTPTTTTDANGDATTDSSSAGIRISGDVQIAGQQVEIFCFAMIQLDGTKIQIIPTRLQFGNDKKTTVVPAEVQKVLLPNFRGTISTGGLPFQVTPTAVRVNSGSVTIKGTAKDVTFSGAPAKG